MRAARHHQQAIFIAAVGLIGLTLPLTIRASPASQPATATTAPTTSLTLSDGRQSIALPIPAGMRQTPQSAPERRVLRNQTGTVMVTFSLLPPDQSITAASAASMVQTSQGSMRQAMGDNLLVAPESRPDPRFPLVMHWRYRISKEATIDATLRWIKAGSVGLQCDLRVTSDDAAAIKSANDAMITELLKVQKQAGAIAAEEPVKREELTGGIEFIPPAGFDDIGTAQGGRTRDFISTDRASEMLLTVLPETTTLDPTSGQTLLAAATKELAAQSLLAGPELLGDSGVPVAIHWSFNKGGKPAQAYRLFRKVGDQVVRVELMTTGDEKASLHLAEQTLLTMTGPEPSPQTVGPKTAKPTHPATSLKPVMSDDQKAAALLAMAGNYAAAGKLDDARSKYHELLSKYPNTSAATKAKQRLANLDHTSGNTDDN